VRARPGSLAAAAVTALAVLAGGEGRALALCLCLNPDQPVCDGGQCYACTSNAECNPLAPNCDVGTGACFNCIISGTSGCPAQAPSCNSSGACTAAPLDAGGPPVDAGTPQGDGGAPHADGGDAGDASEATDASKEVPEAGAEAGPTADSSVDAAAPLEDDAGDAGGASAAATYGSPGLVEGGGCSCSVVDGRKAGAGVATLGILVACAAWLSRRRLT